MKTQVDFYSELYDSNGIDEEKAHKFVNTLDTKVSDSDRNMLDSEITLKDMTNAIKRMNNNKSPGPDGIIIEFYKLYWKETGEHLLQIFKESFNNKMLPYSQYLAVIVLLFKKGDREDLRNWRPISLLNTDTKILSKVLAERLKKVLPQIIHVDQTGCIQGRFIGQNIRLIEDVIEKCDDEEVLVFLDQEKAFDRVEWKWLQMVLTKFGFGENFKMWIELMYSNMKSAILTNGYVSKYFEISRGIRQGDSLSALLYVMQAEPLAGFIRQTDMIEGITIASTDHTDGETEVKSSFYVDDGITFLKNVNMIENCLTIFDEFGEASGSKLHRGKTVGLVMNERVLRETDSPIKLTMGPEKALGVPVGKHCDRNEYWNLLIEKLRKKVNIWRARNLSFTGKVHIIKSLGISLIMYICDMVSVNDKYVKCINEILYDFLWDGKKQIRKEICILPKDMGGIGMADLSIMIKVKRIKWIVRILRQKENEKWNIIPLNAIKCLDNKFGIEFFTLMANDTRELISQAPISPFYKECINSFQEMCRKSKIVDKGDIIWCNNQLKFDGNLWHMHIGQNVEL